jgi:adenylyltransferase/sulfurtransferase
MLTVFDVNGGAGCYRCLYSASPEFIQNCSEAGVIGALPGIIGAMQALEAIKIITGTGEVLNRHTLVYDNLNQTVKKFQRERKKTARFAAVEIQKMRERRSTSLSAGLRR